MSPEGFSRSLLSREKLHKGIRQLPLALKQEPDYLYVRRCKWVVWDTKGKAREQCFGDAPATQGVTFGMNPKFFTVEEANALTGFLENALERIRRNRQRYLWLLEEIAILKLIVECGADEANRDATELDEKTHEIKMVEAEIDRARASVRDSGCILKDEEKGLVDFFSIQNNTVVYLSWKKGEEAVRFWRSIRDADSNVRRPLEGSPST